MGSNLRQALLTRGLGARAQEGTDSDTSSKPRSEITQMMYKSLRPIPTQHYWDVYFDRPPSKDTPSSSAPDPTSSLQPIPPQIDSVQAFWRYANNTPIELIKMRESLYLFKAGFVPVWEDRRNVRGGSWTFRVPRERGKEVWTRVQVMAIGEELEGALADGDQLCGVGLSVRFNAHLISIWHRDSSSQKSIDAILATVLEELPEELRPKADNYFYKKHQDHAGFNKELAAENAKKAAEGTP